MPPRLLAPGLLMAGALAALPAPAQTLLHRYSMNGDAKDSVGGADGRVYGRVSFTASKDAKDVNGAALFPGGVNGAGLLTGGTPGAPPAAFIRLPSGTVARLQNATVEIFAASFRGEPRLGGVRGYYQNLFTESALAPSDGPPGNYAILTANRDPANMGGTGLGIGSRADGRTEASLGSGPPLPATGGLVTLVFDRFTGLGSRGTETIYLDGELVARAGTLFSLAEVAATRGGGDVVGIGGGSPFADPCFNGAITEVRIWDGALSPAQVRADFQAGPGVVPPLAAAGGAAPPLAAPPAPGGVTPLEPITPPAGGAATLPGTLPEAGEIRVEGSVQDVRPAELFLVLSVIRVVQPGGAGQDLARPRSKTVRLSVSTRLGVDQVLLTDVATVLHVGDPVAVIGPDTGAGKDLPARLVLTVPKP